MTKKVSLVTGGTSSIGKEICMSLAIQGYEVCFSYLSSQKRSTEIITRLQAHSKNALALKCNLRNVSEIQTTVNTVFKKFGRLDLLIVSASTFYRTPLLEVTEKEWDDIHDINLKGAFFTLQLAAKKMNQQSHVSRIIALLDTATALSWETFAPYVASKAGLESIIRTFAKALAPNILVNAISPGTVKIPEHLEANPAALLKKIPLKKLGTEKDISDAILFLSNATYLTGETIVIDGGRRLA